MKRKALFQHAKGYFLPLILGNTREGRAIAKEIFSTFGIKSFILDQKSSWRLFFSSSCYFSPLSPTDSARLLCEQLADCADKYPATLPILVPTTREYRDIVEEYREALARRFIIREPSALLLREAPFSSLLASLKKD